MTASAPASRAMKTLSRMVERRQVPPLRLDAVEVVALDDGLHAGDDRILDARVVEVGVAERRGDVVVRPFDVALFEEVRGQREQRLVLLDRQPRVGQGRQLQEAVLPLPVAGFAVEFGQAHRRHGVAVRVGRLSAVDFREDPFGLLQSPVGLQLEGFLLEVHFGVFGQQRHDRVAQRPDLGGVIRAERLVAGVARQVFVVADAGPAVGELLVRGQRPEVDGAEQVGSLHEQPREGIDEGQPQAAFGPQPLVAQRFGDAEVVVDVTRGRVADERGVVVDDLVVDPVAVPERLLRVPPLFQLAEQLLLAGRAETPFRDGAVERPEQ